MATYPTLPTAFGSDPVPVRMLTVDRAEDGTARARVFGSDKAQITVQHPWISAAQKSTLDAFYSANRSLSFDYIDPTSGGAYVCIFGGAPRYTRKEGDYWDASVPMEQV